MYKKLSPIDRKAKSVSGGLKSTRNRQYREIENADTTKKVEQVPQGKLFVRIENVWQDKGNYCLLCNTVMGFDKVLIDKHRYICKAINKSKETDNNANSKSS